MNRKTGVILSYVCMIFEVLSTLLLTPFIIRMLGQAEYGVYKLSASVVAYLLLLDLGIGNATVRYIAKYRVTGDRENEGKFLGVVTIYYGAIAGIALVTGAVLIYVFPSVFAKGLTPDEILLGQKLLAVTVINAAVTLGSAAYTNVILAYERFSVSKGASIIQIILRMALTVAALKAGMGSFGVVSVNLLMTVICRGFFVAYVLFKIKLIPKFRGIEFKFIKEIVIYSTFILLQMVATQINSSVDQILIGSLVSASAAILAVYSVGTQIVQYFQSIGSSFTGVLMPGIVSMVENGADSKQLTDEMVRIGRIIFMVLGLILCGFIVCGRQFVILWAGSDNSEAYIVAVILMTAYLIILTEAIGTQVLWAMNEHKEQSVLKIVIVLLNIVLTAFLINWDPLIGATVGTFISLILGDVVVMNIIFAKKIGINLGCYYRSLFRGILPSLVISTLLGAGVKMFLHSGWTGMLISAFAMTAAYAVCMLMFGMNQYEKHLAFSLLNKFSRKEK